MVQVVETVVTDDDVANILETTVREVDDLVLSPEPDRVFVSGSQIIDAECSIRALNDVAVSLTNGQYCIPGNNYIIAHQNENQPTKIWPRGAIDYDSTWIAMLIVVQTCECDFICDESTEIITYNLLVNMKLYAFIKPSFLLW
ncbi:hypothetical protein CAPTEDRAFT_208893 [Capitella teleta]|uniref:Uncharacterized protein n=1 Tax=Capitella teleta TaxID=283909 RepID=R7UW61_CAPTE|nr:hypothetical protein CAPTEDRAFT_208893 [Capitella teleta]|eukprot:ELU08172.1 hypothetical protein CAPTEDRAFT_208893 [Capitella teleta]